MKEERKKAAPAKSAKKDRPKMRDLKVKKSAAAAVKAGVKSGAVPYAG